MTTQWQLDEQRKPKAFEGYEDVFSEPGRILNNVDYRSHWFVLAHPKDSPRQHVLFVQHGGGEVKISQRLPIVGNPIDKSHHYYVA